MNANPLTAMASRLFPRPSHLPRFLTTVPFRTATTTTKKFSNPQRKKTRYEVALEIGQAKRVPAPEYPHGERRTFKRANRGLFGTAELQAGNKVSKGRNKGKTRRVWLPNVTNERFFSPSLGKNLKIRIQHRVWRTIRKCGGFEEYIMGDTPSRIRELGVFGWRLRWKIMNTPTWKKKFADQRAALGLPTPPVTFAQWMAEQRRAIPGPVLSDEAAGMIEILDDEKKLAETLKGMRLSETKKETAAKKAVKLGESGQVSTPNVGAVAEESVVEQKTAEVVVEEAQETGSEKARKAEAERKQFLNKFF